MTDWFVRPDASHSATRTGASYDNAWGGWTEIVWGSSGVKAGDTLYVCGIHTYSSVIAIGTNGTVSSRITIRGDYETEAGSLAFGTGGFYFNVNRSYITVQALTITAGNNRCIAVTGAPNTGFWLKNCTLNGAASMALDFMPLNTCVFVDVVVDGNTFAGGTGGAINWNPSGAVTTSLSNIRISNNTFNGVSGTRGVIVFLAFEGVNSDTKMTDIVVCKNTYTNCFAVAAEIGGPDGIYGNNAGIKIYDNVITNQQRVGLLGGGFAIGGFGLSSTVGFGTNDIYNNRCYGLHGLTGLANVLFGTYRIFNNYAENLTTGGVDACGILFDYQCKDSIASGNEIRDLHGNGSSNNSPPAGSGILVLDATNCTAYGNLIVNCVTGISFGDKKAAQSSNIFNNTFVNCSYAGAYMMSTADNTTNVVRNNIFTTTTNTTPAVRVNSAPWTGESNNCFHGFGAPVAHTLAASTMTSDPQLDLAYRPRLGSPVVAAGTYLGGMDFYGKEMPARPPIGAIAYYPARALVNRPTKSRAISA